MTTILESSTSSLSDDQLLASVKSLACAERKATAELIAALAEVDRRKLYLGEGFASLFNYCTQVLHLSEHAAYGRIEAVRAVHRFPVVLEHLAATSRPHQANPTAPGSRHIPAAVRREVWQRDGGRCAFVGSAGRCAERGFLELHHVVPFAKGGEAITTNIELRCRAHNAYEAELSFGSFVLREHPVEYNSVRTEFESW
jgi:5-methylcytosine-specific restriction endonuclease McrA